jgi:hypothetical protein
MQNKATAADDEERKYDAHAFHGSLNRQKNKKRCSYGMKTEMDIA